MSSEGKTIVPNDAIREREMRRYLKPGGGFTKDISAADEQRVTEQLADVGRVPADGWDCSIVIANMSGSAKVKPATLEDVLDALSTQSAAIEAQGILLQTMANMIDELS